MAVFDGNGLKKLMILKLLYQSFVPFSIIPFTNDDDEIILLRKYLWNSIISELSIKEKRQLFAKISIIRKLN